MSDRLDRTIERLTPLKTLIDDPSVSEIHLLVGGGVRWRRSGQSAWADEPLDAREVDGVCQALDSLAASSPLGALERGPLRWLRLEPHVTNASPAVFILRVRPARPSAADLVKEGLASPDALKMMTGMLSGGAGFVIAGADPHIRARLLGGLLGTLDASRHAVYIEARARIDLSDLPLTSLRRSMLPEAGSDRAVVEDLIDRADLLIADELNTDRDWAWAIGQPPSPQQRLLTAPGDDPLEVVKGIARRALAAGADPGRGLRDVLNLKALAALAQEGQSGRLLGLFKIPDDPVAALESRTAPLEALLAAAGAPPRAMTPPPRAVDDRALTSAGRPSEEQPARALPAARLEAARPAAAQEPSTDRLVARRASVEGLDAGRSEAAQPPSPPAPDPVIPTSAAAPVDRPAPSSSADAKVDAPSSPTPAANPAPDVAPLGRSLASPSSSAAQPPIQAQRPEPLDEEEGESALGRTSSSEPLQKGSRTPSSDIRARVAEASIERRNAEALARSGSVPTLRPPPSSASRPAPSIIQPGAPSSAPGAGLGRSAGSPSSVSSNAHPVSPESRSRMLAQSGPEKLSDAPQPPSTSGPSRQPVASSAPASFGAQPEAIEARPSGLSPEVAARLTRRLGKPPSSGPWAGEVPSEGFAGAGDVSLATARTQESRGPDADDVILDEGLSPTLDDGSEPLGTSGRLTPIPRRRDSTPRSSPSIPAVSPGLSLSGASPSGASTSGAAILSRSAPSSSPPLVRSGAPTVELEEEEPFEADGDSESPSSGSAALTEAERAAGVMGGVAGQRRMLSGTINRLQRQPPPSSAPPVAASQEQNSLPSSRRMSRYSAINRSATFKPSDDEPPIPGRLRPAGIEVHVGGSASPDAQPQRSIPDETIEDETTVQRDTSALKPVQPDSIDVDETTELNVNKIKKALEEQTRTNPVVPVRRDPDNK